jgi:hypothetical protein
MIMPICQSDSSLLRIEDAYLDQAIEDQLRVMMGMSSDDAWGHLEEAHFYHSPYRPTH